MFTLGFVFIEFSRTYGIGNDKLLMGVYLFYIIPLIWYFAKISYFMKKLHRYEYNLIKTHLRCYFIMMISLLLFSTLEINFTHGTLGGLTRMTYECKTFSKSEIIFRNTLYFLRHRL